MSNNCSPTIISFASLGIIKNSFNPYIFGSYSSGRVNTASLLQRNITGWCMILQREQITHYGSLYQWVRLNNCLLYLHHIQHFYQREIDHQHHHLHLYTVGQFPTDSLHHKKLIVTQNRINTIYTIHFG